MEHENHKIKDKLLSFYKNPFAYLDNLIEKYFKQKLNEAEYLKIKQNILKDMNLFNDQSKDEIKNVLESKIEKMQKEFRNDLHKFLEKEKKTVEEKSNKGVDKSNEKKLIKILQRIEEKLSNFEKIENSKKENEMIPPLKKTLEEISAQEIHSEPIDQQEISNKIFYINSNLIASPKFLSVVNSKQDIKNHILNNNFSSLSQDNIVKKTIECLKGDKIEIPKKNFLEVKNLTLNDIDTDKIILTKNIIHRMRDLDSFKKKNEDEIISHIHKTSVCEKKIFNELMTKANDSIEKIQKNNKITEKIISKVKENLEYEFNETLIKTSLNKLTFHEKNLDSIKDDLEYQQNILCMQERIKLIEENNKKVDEEIEKILAKERNCESNYNKQYKENSFLSDKKIDGLYKKFSKSKKNKNLSKRYGDKKLIRPVTNMNTNMINYKYK